jgi:hypothetical protein
MSDIMGLIVEYVAVRIQISHDLEKWGECSDTAIENSNKYFKDIKTRLSAMQEMCEAAVKFEKECGIIPDSLLGKDHCAQCNLILTVRKLNEVIA